jgi:phosphopantothenate-cysteine ligase
MSTSISRTDSTRKNNAEAAERDYFSENPAPANLERHTSLAKEFIDFHAVAGRRVVFVKKGGSTLTVVMQNVRVF